MRPKVETAILLERGIAVTAIRLLVLGVFLKYKTAFSLKSLEEHLFFSDKSSLFRTLQLFEKKGVLHPVLSSGSEKNYALCKEDCKQETHLDEHAHLKCKNCLQIFCIQMNLSSLFSKETSYKIDDLQLFVNGRCEKCNQVANY